MTTVLNDPQRFQCYEVLSPEVRKMKPRTKLIAIHPVHGYPIPPPQDVKVSRRNARERNRVKTVNSGFDVLKSHIPTAAQIKKMSKVNILSHAVQYIQNLQSMLNDSPDSTNVQDTIKKEKWSGEPLVHYVQHPPICSTFPTEPPVYPPPLTPLSPNTMYYPGNYRQYESGYETYSEPDHLTPQPKLPLVLPSPQPLPSSSHPLAHGLQSNLLELQSPAPSLRASYLLPPKHQVPDQDSSGEEDDILDAIAEWQQTGQ